MPTRRRAFSKLDLPTLGIPPIITRRLSVVSESFARIARFFEAISVLPSELFTPAVEDRTDDFAQDSSTVGVGLGIGKDDAVAVRFKGILQHLRRQDHTQASTEVSQGPHFFEADVAQIAAAVDN
jgi:hypothetical protein